MPSPGPLLLALIPVVSLMTGCTGCVGTGGRLVPLTPDPPTPVSIKIYNSDIHLINDSEEELRGLSITVHSALSGANHTKTFEKMERKGYLLLPSYETRWYLVEGEALTVEADGHSPTRSTVHLRATDGR